MDQNETAAAFLRLWDGYEKRHIELNAKGAEKDESGKVKPKVMTVEGPLTPELAWAHLEGKRSIGVAPVKAKEAARVFCRAYYKRPEVKARWKAMEAERRALELSATPPWLSDSQRAAIKAIYAEATRLERETGIPRHVDHIVPLKHPDVCGLHVPWNLQVLTATENLSKNNHFDGTIDNEGWRERLAQKPLVV